MKKFAAILIAATLFFCVGCSDNSGGYVDYETLVFSDVFALSVSAAGASESVMREVEERLQEIEDAVTLTGESSLTNFNAAAAAERIEVDKTCYDIVLLAKEYYALTSGAFNPALLPLQKLWGLDADSLNEKVVTLPTIGEVNAALALCSLDHVNVIESEGKYYLQKSIDGLQLDLGGIAKGYATDAIQEIFVSRGVSSALVDLSGNILLFGARKGEEEWRIGITAPRPRDISARGVVCALGFSGDVSVVTSGDYERYKTYSYGKSEVYLPHIIGRDGLPIGVVWNEDTEEYENTVSVSSATVIASSGALADALSTAYAVDGFSAEYTANHEVLLFTETEYSASDNIKFVLTDRYDGYRSYNEH